ncbi:MAG: hypothetical protein ACM3SW_06565 [Actinomycetota bacterium]
MPKKGRGAKEEQPDLWVAPQYSLKGPRGERAWENRSGGPPSNSRYLELADIALGLKKSVQRKLRLPTAHQTGKKEPYSPPE